MTSRPKTQGFTLSEVMFTVAIFTFVAAAVFAAYLGSVRLLKIVFSEAELSIRTRELREKLLFRAAPPHDNVLWAGLLSGTNSHQAIEGNGSKILLHCTALKGTTSPQGTVDQTIQLIFHDAGSSACSIFSEDRTDEHAAFRWLHPGNLDFFAGDPTPANIFVADTTDPGRFYVNITARKDIGGFQAQHNERIVVPVFGRTQRSEADGTGGLGR